MSPTDVFVNPGAVMRMGGTPVHKALWSSARPVSQRRKRRRRVADASPGDYVPKGNKGQPGLVLGNSDLPLGHFPFPPYHHICPS